MRKTQHRFPHCFSGSVGFKNKGGPTGLGVHVGALAHALMAIPLRESLVTHLASGSHLKNAKIPKPRISQCRNFWRTEPKAMGNLSAPSNGRTLALRVNSRCSVALKRLIGTHAHLKTGGAEIAVRTKFKSNRCPPQSHSRSSLRRHANGSTGGRFRPLTKTDLPLCEVYCHWLSKPEIPFQSSYQRDD